MRATLSRSVLVTNIATPTMADRLVDAAAMRGTSAWFVGLPVP
jgi:hypothetical protein